MEIGAMTRCGRMSSLSGLWEIDWGRVDSQLTMRGYGLCKSYAMLERGTIRAQISSIPARGKMHPALSPCPLRSVVMCAPSLCSKLVTTRRYAPAAVTAAEFGLVNCQPTIVISTISGQPYSVALPHSSGLP